MQNFSVHRPAVQQTFQKKNCWARGTSILIPSLAGVNFFMTSHAFFTSNHFPTKHLRASLHISILCHTFHTLRHRRFRSRNIRAPSNKSPLLWLPLLLGSPTTLTPKEFAGHLPPCGPGGVWRPVFIHPSAAEERE